jgi:L-2-hydroxyglutarate oxidase
MQHAQVIIVGGGIIGLATAYQFLQRYPDRSVLVLEKEPAVGQHQTGHNSGVLHSGIYYKPGSLKARNGRSGKEAMERFCEREEIPYDICGKVIVAVTDDEIPRLERIQDRGQQNGVRCEIIGPERLRELEPHAAGVQAIHVPEAGIANFRRVAERLSELVSAGNGEVACGARVTGVTHKSDGVVVHSTQGDYTADFLVNCGGLHCDRVTRMTGQTPNSKVVPFRGEFYELKTDVHHLCRNLIYPVPNPDYPFLGVHFTRMIDGGVECGPNAVLAFAREGYRKTDINIVDLAESLCYRGFRKLATRYWRVGFGEMWRSFSKAAFVKALQRLMPEIQSEHLRSGRTGVRAQAISPDGSIVDDFCILEGDRVVNVENAPSPAATSSLNVGNLIVDRLEKHFD